MGKVMRQKGFSAVEGLVIVLVLAVVGLGGWYVWDRQTTDADSDQNTGQSVPGALSETQMREEFRCGRQTADALATDVYCNDYDQYLEDFQAGIVLGPNEFNEHYDMLIKEFFDDRDEVRRGE